MRLLKSVPFCSVMGVICLAIPVSATKQTPPTQSVLSTSNALAPFLDPAPGIKQFVINLPARSDEQSYRVGIIAGRMEQTDGVNRVRIAGRLVEKTLQGWGYSYHSVEGAKGPSASTRMGVAPGTPPSTPHVTKFSSLQEKLVRYNSRLPLVIYAPDNFEVRYRIYEAGQTEAARVNAGGGAVATPYAVALSYHRDVHVPIGSTVTLRYYDSMLMDTDSAYARIERPISKLPARLALPVIKTPSHIAGPAISVTIRDVNGKLLFWNDTSTPVNSSSPTDVKMKRASKR